MRVVSCLVTEHNLWLVLLSGLTCLSGTWVALGLFRRARDLQGQLKQGWVFLAAVATGSSVWCTHFIAMLAYETSAPVSFEPWLTMLSLLIVIGGSGLGLALALARRPRFAPEIGGAIIGFSIAGMHYMGMAAYRVEGLVSWDPTYIAASVLISAILASLALSENVRQPTNRSKHNALGLFVLAVTGLHFTGMAGVSVVPMAPEKATTDPAVLQTMAFAVALVGLLVAATGVASYVIDARASLESLQRLQHLAHNDSLTGLPNRLSFGLHLEKALAAAKETNTRLALLGIDLDRFKEINDVHGHNAGDETLKTISSRLARLQRDGEFIARVGGDEYAAVKRFTDHDDLLDFVARLESRLFEPVRLGDIEATTGASIGIAIYPEDGDTQERLLSNADLAMYRAKADVARAVCFYEPKMDELSRARRSMAKDLRRAIELGQLDLHYQVQTAVSTGRVRGYEVLLRWHHPERGSVPPSDFIPVAEENGLILAIGEWVLRTACREAATWETPYKIAVNLSPVQFSHSDLAKLVHEILFETGLSPSRLELEITESTIIADKVRTLQTLRQIRALGVTVALDDFGTGYSSLDTLRSFPFDKIKLDRSFMSEVERSPQAKAIVRAVLALGKSLDIAVLAEGVETDEQLSILRTEGCDEAQGYFLGRPKPISLLFAAGAVPDDNWNGNCLDFSGRLRPARVSRR